MNLVPTQNICVVGNCLCARRPDRPRNVPVSTACSMERSHIGPDQDRRRTDRPPRNVDESIDPVTWSPDLTPSCPIGCLSGCSICREHPAGGVRGYVSESVSARPPTDQPTGRRDDGCRGGHRARGANGVSASRGSSDGLASEANEALANAVSEGSSNERSETDDDSLDGRSDGERSEPRARSASNAMRVSSCTSGGLRGPGCRRDRAPLRGTEPRRRPRGARSRLLDDRGSRRRPVSPDLVRRPRFRLATIPRVVGL